MISSAFTCTGPYAILAMLGIKTVENRNVLPMPLKGRCAVSCSKSFSAVEYGNFVQWASRTLLEDDFVRIPSWNDVREWPGKIVGAVDYAASRDQPFELSALGKSSFDWDEGYPYWWKLSSIACFASPIPCYGNVGMWQLPSDLQKCVMAADILAQSIGEKVSTIENVAHIFAQAIPLAGVNEGVFVMPLDAEQRILSEPVLISLGDTKTATVRPMDVFATAFKYEASSVILAHNHPSGDSTPSIQDRQFTKTIALLGEQLGIRLIDHLVIGENGCDVVSLKQPT